MNNLSFRPCTPSTKDEAPWDKSQPSYRETLCRETETGGREKGNNIFFAKFQNYIMKLEVCSINAKTIVISYERVKGRSHLIILPHRKNSPKQSQEIILHGYSETLGIICNTGNNFVQSIPKK